MKYLFKMIKPLLYLIWYTFLTIYLISERLTTLLRLIALFLWGFKLTNKDLSFMHEIKFFELYFDNVKDFYKHQNYRYEPAKYYD
jgi:hypothetical protein